MQLTGSHKNGLFGFTVDVGIVEKKGLATLLNEEDTGWSGCVVENSPLLAAPFPKSPFTPPPFMTPVGFPKPFDNVDDGVLPIIPLAC